MSAILFVAAEAREFDGLLRHCRGVQRLDWPLEFARRAELNGRAVILAANGAGRRHAAEAVEVARARSAASEVVSTGYCGALDPEYDIGDIIVADRIASAGQIFPVSSPSCKRPHRIGTLISQDRVASTVEEKRSLRRQGAAAVDMEAAGVAQTVRQWGLPLYCVRVVTDTSGEQFCLDLNGCRLPDGRFSVWKILGQALAGPRTGIPELLRLRRTSIAASLALGDFLADCRF